MLTIVIIILYYTSLVKCTPIRAVHRRRTCRLYVLHLRILFCNMYMNKFRCYRPKRCPRTWCSLDCRCIPGIRYTVEIIIICRKLTVTHCDLRFARTYPITFIIVIGTCILYNIAYTFFE